jgi:hypothetical protein
MLAVERRKQDFVPAEEFSRTAAAQEPFPDNGKAKTSGYMNAQSARSRRLPTGRRGNTPGGSLRIVSGLAENTNSIICDGSREPETANGCPVLHRMRGPSAVRHSCAT